MLPPRDQGAEDAFIGAWTVSPDTDGLIDAIEAAMEARRPRLAARLVGLLSDHLEVDPDSHLARAQAAARLLLHTRADAAFDDLADAWRAARRAKMARIKQRMRRSLHGDGTRVPRVPPRSRKP